MPKPMMALAGVILVGAGVAAKAVAAVRQARPSPLRPSVASSLFFFMTEGLDADVKGEEEWSRDLQWRRGAVGRGKKQRCPIKSNNAAENET